jgi:type IV pilus assembly protein PilB
VFSDFLQTANAMAKSVDFTEILIQRGVISTDQLADAQAVAVQNGNSLPDELIHLGYATGDEVMRAVAEEHSLEYIVLEDTVIPPSVVELIPESVARENTVLPYKEEDETLTVIVCDPFDLETMDKLRFILNKKIEIALSPRESLHEAINRYYGQIAEESADSMLQEFTDTAIDFTETEDAEISEDEVVDENSAPIVRLVQLMITEAVQLRASDIHIEPFEERVRIRYRIDGRLIERDSPPRRMLGPLISRVKILARIDIAERRRPQDGRIKVETAGKELDLRVSVIPTNHGQSVVMRLLDKENIKIGVQQLGLSQANHDRFGNLLRRPNGIILVTGPTGSGKTTTLYAVLNEMNRPDRKIITAEDPVEYYLPGINQVEIRHRIGLDFARVIRSMLRQAPNVILVGEMRDLETASMGIQAALTGHLVFSTLHTNDAPSAVTRMIDLGVPGYLVASSVIGLIAQRLIRVICSHCKESYQPKEAELEAAGIPSELAKTGEFARGKGCGRCQRGGFQGRLGIFEMMPVSSKIRELIFAGESSIEIRKAAIKEGMTTLYTDGIDKVLNGVTTLEEVYRVAKPSESDFAILQQIATPTM